MSIPSIHASIESSPNLAFDATKTEFEDVEINTRVNQLRKKIGSGLAFNECYEFSSFLKGKLLNRQHFLKQELKNYDFFIAETNKQLNEISHNSSNLALPGIDLGIADLEKVKISLLKTQENKDQTVIKDTPNVIEYLEKIMLIKSQSQELYSSISNQLTHLKADREIVVNQLKKTDEAMIMLSSIDQKFISEKKSQEEKFLPLLKMIDEINGKSPD